MKRPTEKHSDQLMRFFTPDLYLRYNSRDDAVADIADDDWEQSLLLYKKHLAEFSDEMNSRVRELAESRCLHDAILLSLQEDAPSPRLPRPYLSPIPVTTISLKSDEVIINIIYFLWNEVHQSQSPENWPFSKARPHWLYDEIDRETRENYLPLYWHRILLSDGRVFAVPFFDAVVQSFSAQDPETVALRRSGA
jgi:hypothetical protein